MGEQIPEKLCGRPLSAADMETIRREIHLADPPIRSEIARRVCRALAVDQRAGAAEADELPGGSAAPAPLGADRAAGTDRLQRQWPALEA